jgi:hypothetical protein
MSIIEKKSLDKQVFPKLPTNLGGQGTKKKDPRWALLALPGILIYLLGIDRGD